VKSENGNLKAASKRVCGSLLTHKASEAGSIARSAVKGENLFSIATGAMCHTERSEVSRFFRE
jgi:hypothetical protein